MECYAHENTVAVGICKACNKAVCRGCVIELENGIACSENCKQFADESNQVMERSFKIYGIGKYNSKIPATGVIMWGMFTAIAWLSFLVPYLYKNKFNSTSLILSILFTIVTGLVVYSAKRTGVKC